MKVSHFVQVKGDNQKVVGSHADAWLEKKKLFDAEQLSIHIYALSPAPVKVCASTVCSDVQRDADEPGPRAIPRVELITPDETKLP